MLLNHGRDYGLGMDAIVMYALGTRTLFWFGHGCSSHRMLLDHRHYYGLGVDASHRMFLEHGHDYGSGMDALVNVCN